MKIRAKSNEETHSIFFFVLILMSLCALAFGIRPILGMAIDWAQEFAATITPHILHIH
jgi:hypothetical protein